MCKSQHEPQNKYLVTFWINVVKELKYSLVLTTLAKVPIVITDRSQKGTGITDREINSGLNLNYRYLK